MPGPFGDFEQEVARARIFLLVDLQEFFSDLESGDKKKIKKL